MAVLTLFKWLVVVNCSFVINRAALKQK